MRAVDGGKGRDRLWPEACDPGNECSQGQNEDRHLHPEGSSLHVLLGHCIDGSNGAIVPDKLVHGSSLRRDVSLSILRPLLKSANAQRQSRRARRLVLFFVFVHHRVPTTVSERSIEIMAPDQMIRTRCLSRICAGEGEHSSHVPSWRMRCFAQ